MKDMFSDAANFSSISDENLKVDKVVQKAYIEVNEEGSEAVSVTYGELTFFNPIFTSLTELISDGRCSVIRHTGCAETYLTYQGFKNIRFVGWNIL